MRVVAERLRVFVAAVGSQSFGRTAVAVHQVDVHTALASRCKGDVLPVGAPYGISIIGRVGRQLAGIPASDRNGVDVAFVRKRDG